MKKEANQFQSGLRWYALFTKPLQEALVVASLQREGYEIFYPRVRHRRPNRLGQRPWAVEPMFPRYVFVRLDISQSKADVCYQQGVIKLVNFNGKYPTVADETIGELRAIGQQDVVTLTDDEFQPGDLLEVQDGPLRGLRAVFLRDSNAEERARVLLELLLRRAEAEIERELLEKV